MYTSDSITEPDFAIESRAKSLKNAHVLVLIIDLANHETFARLDEKFALLAKHRFERWKPIMLIGNKVDIDKLEVDPQEVFAFAQE